jgi:hypothetical protein
MGVFKALVYWLTGVRPISAAEDEALRKSARYHSAEELLRDVARREGRDLPDHDLRIGDRIRLFGAYDDPAWLGGRDEVRGVVVDIIPGENDVPAVVVELDEPLHARRAQGQWVVLQLRYVGATWKNVGIVNIELLQARPPAMAQYRPTGTLVETHATYELTQ